MRNIFIIISLLLVLNGCKFHTATSDKPFFPNDFKDAYELLDYESFIFSGSGTDIHDWHLRLKKKTGYKAAYESDYLDNIVFIRNKGKPIKEKYYNEYYNLLLVQASSKITKTTYYVFLKEETVIPEGKKNSVKPKNRRLSYLNNRPDFTLYTIIRKDFINNIHKIDLDNLSDVFHERKSPNSNDFTLRNVKRSSDRIEYKGIKYRASMLFAVDKSEKRLLAHLLDEVPKEKVASKKKREYGQKVSTAFHNFLLSRCNRLTALSTKGAEFSSLSLRKEGYWCTTSNLGTKLSFRLRTIRDLSCSEKGNNIHQCSFDYKLACEMKSTFSNEPENFNFFCNLISSKWHPAKGTFKQMRDGTFESIKVDIGQ